MKEEIRFSMRNRNNKRKLGALWRNSLIYKKVRLTA